MQSVPMVPHRRLHSFGNGVRTPLTFLTENLTGLLNRREEKVSTNGRSTEDM